MLALVVKKTLWKLDLPQTPLEELRSPRPAIDVLGWDNQTLTIVLVTLASLQTPHKLIIHFWLLHFIYNDLKFFIFEQKENYQKIVIYIALNAPFFSQKCTKIVSGECWELASLDPLAVMGLDRDLMRLLDLSSYPMNAEKMSEPWVKILDKCLKDWNEVELRGDWHVCVIRHTYITWCAHTCM